MDDQTGEGNIQGEGKERRRKDTRQCRICLAGVEDEPELGRLIKPCKCKGSIRYVHVQCINTWRKTGTTTNQNFWACAQCGHKYNISRTKILGLSNTPWVLVPTTVAFFLAIVFAASFVVSFFIPELDDPLLLVPRPPMQEVDPREFSMAALTWQSPFGIASDVIRETIHAFAEVSTPREVLLEARRQESLRNVDDTSAWGRFKKKIRFKDVGKAEHGKKSGIAARRIDPRAPFSPSEEGPRVTFWMRLLRKFMLGLSLVGILAFLNLLVTFSLFGPLQLTRRWIRGGRREAGGVRDAGTILIVIFVTIGVARAVYGVYTMTKVLAQYVLQKAENAILEVQDENGEEGEEEQEGEAPTKEDAAQPTPGPADDGWPTSAAAGTESSLRRRPGALNLDGTRAINMGDNFGGELPDTPGGWRGEWDIL